MIVGAACRRPDANPESTNIHLDAPHALSGEALARAASSEASSTRAASVIGLVTAAHPWLQMSAEDLARFADDLVTHSPARLDEATYVQRTVLLSTDLFDHGDDTRSLRYVRLFHPYASPCHSPLTRPPDAL
jgi:hypothetical protein